MGSAAAEGGEDWDAEGDLVPEISGAGELEDVLGSERPEAVELGGLGVGGAAAVDDVRDVIICWPATL